MNLWTKQPLLATYLSLSLAGIPNDADKAQQYSSEPFKLDPYGRWYPGWVTLKEILEYPHWDKKILWKDSPDDEGIRISYREMCKGFLDEFIPKLKELSERPENLRLVYHFW